MLQAVGRQVWGPRSQNTDSFEAGLKRPRDATESAKLVSEEAVAVRCHVRILPTWIQYRNDKEETQFNTFLDHLSVSMVMYGN